MSTDGTGQLHLSLPMGFISVLTCCICCKIAAHQQSRRWTHPWDSPRNPNGQKSSGQMIQKVGLQMIAKSVNQSLSMVYDLKTGLNKPNHLITGGAPLCSTPTRFHLAFSGIQSRKFFRETWPAHEQLRFAATISQQFGFTIFLRKGSGWWTKTQCDLEIIRHHWTLVSQKQQRLDRYVHTSKYIAKLSN